MTAPEDTRPEEHRPKDELPKDELPKDELPEDELPEKDAAEETTPAPDDGPRDEAGEAAQDAQAGDDAPGTPDDAAAPAPRPDDAPAAGGSGSGGDEPPSGDDDEDGDEDGAGGSMTLLQHLEELRKRLIRSVIAIVIGFGCCYAFSKELFEWLMAPMAAVLDGGHFQYTYPPEAFFTYIKVSLVAGFFLASPYIFIQIWGFVAPGLYAHERKWFFPVAFSSALLFVTGAIFGYYVVFPYGFEFFASFSTEEIKLVPKLNEYTGMAIKLLFAFGIAFEMPLFVFFLARLGMVTSRAMRKFRKYAILLSFVCSAILTPPDPFTQSLMAGPLILLYEVSVWVARLFGKREKEKDEEPEEDAAEEAATEDGDAD